MILTIKKKWFDMILSGEKKEEYREIKPYYIQRLANLWVNNYLFATRKVEDKCECYLEWQRARETSPFGNILFRNGYSKDSPSFNAECNLRIGTGNPEWGAEENKEYFVFEIAYLYSK